MIFLEKMIFILWAFLALLGIVSLLLSLFTDEDLEDER